LNNNRLNIFLFEDRSAFEPGDRITLEVRWELVRVPSSLEVQLAWFTRGKGKEDSEIVASYPVMPETASGEDMCSFQLPVAPWSFFGKHVSLVWRAQAVAKSPSVEAAVEFVVAPGASVIVLHKLMEDISRE
jgi:hypothetical protein